jgi:soluble lytic murein transglycosylase-like protein
MKFRALFFVLLAIPASANATRPLILPSTAIKNLRMAMPIAFEKAMDGTLLGIDQEDAEARKIILKQAEEYTELRRGKMPKAQADLWLEKCEKLENKDANPFCAYELQRKGISSTRSKTVRSPMNQAIATDLLESRFEKLISKEQVEITSGVRHLENHGNLGKVAMHVADMQDCVAASIPFALAYKLEERFPAPEAIELAKRLYRKASTCSSDFAAAQSSFRLGLIGVWQKKCDEVPELMARVETIPSASQYFPRAKFWRYHCADEKGDEEAKAAARESLIKDHPMSFQTLAAIGADESVMAQVMAQETPKVALRSIVRPDLNPIFRATEALVKIGTHNLAAELIDRNVKDIGSIEPEVRLYLAVVLNRIGYALPKFKILTELFQDAPKTVSLATLRLFFPLWYYDEVKSKQETVDPLLIISLIRQESAFNKEAHSSAGARGLMQVMPGTARSVASVRSIKLYDPGVNISVGTKYFLKRLKQYDGDVELTLAAYNAGFSRVDQWKKRYPTDNKLLFLDFIPFKETRDYVSSILRNYYWYVKLYTSEKAAVAVEGLKTQPLSAKVNAIVSANAGLAAALTPGTFEK